MAQIIQKVNLIILLDHLLFLSAVPEVTCASDKCEGRRKHERWVTQCDHLPKDVVVL